MQNITPNVNKMVTTKTQRVSLSLLFYISFIVNISILLISSIPWLQDTNTLLLLSYKFNLNSRIFFSTVSMLLGRCYPFSFIVVVHFKFTDTNSPNTQFFKIHMLPLKTIIDLFYLLTLNKNFYFNLSGNLQIQINLFC